MVPRAYKLACQRLERRHNAFDENAAPVPQHLLLRCRVRSGYWTALLGVMRIITWNCNRAFRNKVEVLLDLKPDVAVIQECERDLEVPPGYKYIWTGVLPKMGLGILTRDLEARVEPQADSNWTFFLPITLPNLRLNLLGTWAFNGRAKKISPGRIGTVAPVLERLAPWLQSGRSVMAGDFNQNIIWDTPRGTNNFRMIVHRLRQLGLRSAYHEATLEGYGAEKHATHLFRRKASDQYHIDYCFLHHSLEWSNVEVKSSPEWCSLSDHFPLVIDVVDP